MPIGWAQHLLFMLHSQARRRRRQLLDFRQFLVLPRLRGQEGQVGQEAQAP